MVVLIIILAMTLCSYPQATRIEHKAYQKYPPKFSRCIRPEQKERQGSLSCEPGKRRLIKGSESKPLSVLY
ncbi:hypothetical protein FKM82_021890 [Ascaphus truei]